jgi:hypothetical protein
MSPFPVQGFPFPVLDSPLNLGFSDNTLEGMSLRSADVLPNATKFMRNARQKGALRQLAAAKGFGANYKAGVIRRLAGDAFRNHTAVILNSCRRDAICRMLFAVEARRADQLIAAHHPKNLVVTSFSNSLQNKKFCELLLGRPDRQVGRRIRSNSIAEGAALDYGLASIPQHSRHFAHTHLRNRKTSLRCTEDRFRF